MGSEEIESLSLVSMNLLMSSYNDGNEKGAEVFSALPVPFLWTWKVAMASSSPVINTVQQGCQSQGLWFFSCIS